MVKKKSNVGKNVLYILIILVLLACLAGIYWKYKENKRTVEAVRQEVIAMETEFSVKSVEPMAEALTESGKTR